MCPATIAGYIGVSTTTMYVAMAAAVVAAAYSASQAAAANRSAKKQSKLLTRQAIDRDSEINTAAGEQLNARAKAARQERAAARASAAESGVNLGSGSFLAQLSTSQVNQYNDNGIITKNAEEQKKATGVQYESGLAGLQIQSGLGIALGAAAAGVSAGSGVVSAGQSAKHTT